MAVAFEGVRVVDLSDRLSGAYAARMFGDFGAEVILAEPSRGHGLRHEAPFLDDEPGIERGLLHAYANWNKRSIVPQSHDELMQIVASADVIVTSAQPPWTGELAETISAIDGRAIHLSITPHGLQGPLASVAGNNLTACARTGWCSINGRRDEPPLQLPNRQTGYIAGVAGFVGGAAALLRSRMCGVGERVDVSEIEALALTNAPWAILGLFLGGERLDYGPAGGRPRDVPGPLWKTADGAINFGYGDWAKWREAMMFLGLPELAEDERFEPVLGRNQQDTRPVRDGLARVVATRDSWEIFHGLANVRCIAGVVQDAQQLLRNDQLEARRFFVTTHVDGRKVRAPGAPSKLSGTPWSLQHPAPALNEHGDAIRATLRERSTTLPTGSRVAAREEANGERAQPLAGVRVLTFTQAWSGTFATELLALLGADVVQIETRRRPDVWRGAGAPVGAAVRDPSREQSPLNNNGMYNSVNLDKRAITLDMGDPRGMEIFWRMLPAFDVLADNFSPHVMSNWGITMETLGAHRPDIIFASLSGYGREGPLAEYPANGATTEPMSGLSSLHGYEGDVAMNTGGLIPDPISGYYFAGAIMAALHHRHATGQGQRIDLSMMEAVAVQVGDAVMEVEANGRVPGPLGNRHPAYAPHGIYPTRDGEWLAIAAETDAAWESFADHMGASALAVDPRFASVSARKRNESALDEIVAAWCADRDAAAEAQSLGALGLSAARVEPFKPIYEAASPQFAAREFLVAVTHPESGTHLLPLLPWTLARTPRAPVRYSPCFGEHSREVFREELGQSDAEYETLEADGVTGTTRLP